MGIFREQSRKKRLCITRARWGAIPSSRFSRTAMTSEAGGVLVARMLHRGGGPLMNESARARERFGSAATDKMLTKWLAKVRLGPSPWTGRCTRSLG